jgi:hypothetical protein
MEHPRNWLYISLLTRTVLPCSFVNNNLVYLVESSLELFLSLTGFAIDFSFRFNFRINTATVTALDGSL